MAPPTKVSNLRFMKKLAALIPVTFFFVWSCDDSPRAPNAPKDAPGGEISETNPLAAPEAESSGGISSVANAGASDRERFDKKLLAGGYELESMRAFIKKNSEGLSVDETYSFHRKFLAAARGHNFEGCLDIVSGEIDSFDQELTAGGDLFFWAGEKGDQTVDAYLSKIKERSTNPDALRHYSKRFISGVMISGRDRIDDLVAYTLKSEDPVRLNHFCDQIASSFRGSIAIPDAETSPGEIAWSDGEIPSESPMKNSDILIKLLEERGRDLDQPSLRKLVDRAVVAGVVSDKAEALKEYSEQVD